MAFEHSGAAIDQVGRLITWLVAHREPPGDPVVAAIRRFEELERFRRGDLTTEEFHNLCHNMHEKPGCTPADHTQGCVDYQKKLFGCSPIEEWQQLASAFLSIEKLKACLEQMPPGADDAEVVITLRIAKPEAEKLIAKHSQ